MMPGNERLIELMAQRATEGLASADEREFDELAAAERGTEVDAFEYAAAAFQLAYLDVEPMPEEVSRNIALPPRKAPSIAPKTAPRMPSRLWPQAGWIAAAALLVVTILVWPRAETLDEGSALRASWKPVDERYGGVAGEVVWDEQSQRGYMVFRGLPVNDPSKEQYQLWIVDGREEHYKHPVDGGVFDAASTGEIRVPIDAKLPVERAKAFVITAEQPGGVVVSDGPFLVVAER